MSTAVVSEAVRLLERFREVRALTMALRAPLEVEDLMLQSMPDASPMRWHLAHTTWFFETFVLARADPGYEPPHPAYAVLFNSYYNGVGDQYPRPKRHLVSRPTVAEVEAYRAEVDERVMALLDTEDEQAIADVLPIVQLGLHHERQHQELMLTDVKHAFWHNPLLPAYTTQHVSSTSLAPPLTWTVYEEGLTEIGRDEIGPGAEGFAFDNETPRHRVFLEPFEIADRLVTVREYLDFIEDGGYVRPELWLSEGWDRVRAEGWEAPLYWRVEDDRWQHFTLNGLRPLDENEPVCHVSYYEADAYARWADARLPSEAEWETVAAGLPVEGNFLESRRLHTAPAPGRDGPEQYFGDAWEWTASAYAPYPGYRPLDGALGEYNGKFMSNQMVLRGGSCVSAQSHLRATYRNFFAPHARWQFSGIRLAR